MAYVYGKNVFLLIICIIIFLPSGTIGLFCTDFYQFLIVLLSLTVYCHFQSVVSGAAKQGIFWKSKLVPMTGKKVSKSSKGNFLHPLKVHFGNGKKWYESK